MAIVYQTHTKMNFREQYFNVWGEAWNFHKQFANMAGTDEDWKTVVDAAGEMVEGYRDKPQYAFMAARNAR